MYGPFLDMKYGVRGTDGQATSRWQTDVQEGQGGWPRGHRHSSGQRMFENNAMARILKIIVGKVATITCAHGDTKIHPLAEVEIELEGVHIHVEAALSEELPASVLLS